MLVLHAGVAGGSMSDAAQADDDPELFRLALPRPAQPGDMFNIRISYFEPLTFLEGSYLVTLPSVVPPGVAAAPHSPLTTLLKVWVSDMQAI